MRDTVRWVIERFQEPSDDLPRGKYSPRDYRLYVVTNYVFSIAALVHVGFILLFFLIGVPSLALFNVLSVALWLFAVYCNFTGRDIRAVVIGSAELIVHAVLCTVIIGWDTGFHYYMWTLPIMFSSYFETVYWKVGGVLVSFVSHALLYLSVHSLSPGVSLPPAIVNAMNYGNMFSVFALLGLIAYFINYGTERAERKLAAEHRRANAALVERNQALEQLQVDLNEALEYVVTMLPEPITEGGVRTDWRFVPSASLGGDAFGYHWIDGDHFAIYLIDVSGHGVGAALLSVTVMNVLRSHAVADADPRDPQQVLESLNNMFPGEEQNDMFFTMWYGVYHRPTRTLSYASGGHPPALLFSAVAREKPLMTPLRTPNYVIGGIPDLRYKKENQTIAALSKLYVFSDGVYELAKADGSMWRFKDFLKFMDQPTDGGSTRIDRLVRHAEKISGAKTFFDDFTILEVNFN